jgi:hypothetical protein
VFKYVEKQSLVVLVYKSIGMPMSLPKRVIRNVRTREIAPLLYNNRIISASERDKYIDMFEREEYMQVRLAVSSYDVSLYCTVGNVWDVTIPDEDVAKCKSIW